MQVLILEYDAILCDLIALRLRQKGYVPVICEDPVFIHEELEDHHPDVMILDTRLPDQNGIDLLKGLNEEDLLNNMYVIVLSALGFSCIIRHAVDAGADDFLVKPVDLDLLVQKLENIAARTAK